MHLVTPYKPEPFGPEKTDKTNDKTKFLERLFDPVFTFIHSNLNKGDPAGLLLQSHTRTLPPPLAVFDICTIVLRKRFYLLLLSEDRSELPPHLLRQLQRFSLTFS